MDSVVKFLQPYQLHPVVDHFSVALFFTAVLIDLVAQALTASGFATPRCC